MKSILIYFLVNSVVILFYFIHGQTIDTKFATPCNTPNNEIGICTEHQSCPVVLKIINQVEFQDYVNESKCGPKNEDQSLFRVCCPIRRETSSTAAPPPPQPTMKPKEKLLPPMNETKRHSCGVQPVIVENRIFGGQNATLGEFPWMVQLQHRSEYGNLRIGCTGFLIDDLHVITAAHCVQSVALKSIGPIYQVILGEHTVGTEVDCNENRTICAAPIVKIKTYTPIPHPGYNASSFDHHNDIAIIPLRTRVPFSDFIQPICLLNKSSNMREMWISGWGRTELEATSINKLRASVSSVTNEECQRIYSQVNVNITNKQVCAGDEGKDTCRGDSGGPLMVKDDNNIWYAEGIVSFGYVCGKKEWPGVYTNIPSYFDWITNAIAKEQVKGN